MYVHANFQDATIYKKKDTREAVELFDQPSYIKTLPFKKKVMREEVELFDQPSLTFVDLFQISSGLLKLGISAYLMKWHALV